MADTKCITKQIRLGLNVLFLDLADNIIMLNLLNMSDSGILTDGHIALELLQFLEFEGYVFLFCSELGRIGCSC